MLTAVVAARILLVVVFATAGVAKGLDLPSTRRSVEGFGIPAALAPSVAVVLVASELTVAVMLTWAATAWLGGLLALVLLVLFCVAAGVNLARGRAPECNCFGQVHSEPVGPQLLVRNAAFAVAAAVIVIGGAADAGPSLWAWMEDLSVAEGVLLAGGVALAAAVALLASRLRSMGAAHEQLASTVARLQAELAAATNGDSSVGPSNDVPAAEAEVPAFAPGLPIGTPAPAFSLEATDGRAELDGLLALGKPVVLLFVAPTCRTCHELLPKPASWAATYGDVLSFALITAGTPEANRGMEELSGGFEPVLFDPGSARNAYEVAATPGGVVVDLDGTIRTETVYGVAEIAMVVMRSAAQERAKVQPAG